MDEDIVIPIAGMIMVVVLCIGVPLVLALIRKWEREARAKPVQQDALSADRLERIEQAVDAIAVEVERLGEGQRFVSKLMSERQPERAAIPGGGSNNGQ